MLAVGTPQNPTGSTGTLTTVPASRQRARRPRSRARHPRSEALAHVRDHLFAPPPLELGSDDLREPLPCFLLFALERLVVCHQPDPYVDVMELPEGCLERLERVQADGLLRERWLRNLDRVSHLLHRDPRAVDRLGRQVRPCPLQPFIQATQPLPNQLSRLSPRRVCRVGGRLQQGRQGLRVPSPQVAAECRLGPLQSLLPRPMQSGVAIAEPGDLKLQVAHVPERVLKTLHVRVQVAKSQQAQGRAKPPRGHTHPVHGVLRRERFFVPRHCAEQLRERARSSHSRPSAVDDAVFQGWIFDGNGHVDAPAEVALHPVTLTLLRRPGPDGASREPQLRRSPRTNCALPFAPSCGRAAPSLLSILSLLSPCPAEATPSPVRLSASTTSVLQPELRRCGSPARA